MRSGKREVGLTGLLLSRSPLLLSHRSPSALGATTRTTDSGRSEHVCQFWPPVRGPIPILNPLLLSETTVPIAIARERCTSRICNCKFKKNKHKKISHTKSSRNYLTFTFTRTAKVWPSSQASRPNSTASTASTKRYCVRLLDKGRWAVGGMGGVWLSAANRCLGVIQVYWEKCLKVAGMLKEDVRRVHR